MKEERERDRCRKACVEHARMQVCAFDMIDIVPCHALPMVFVCLCPPPAA